MPALALPSHRFQPVRPAPHAYLLSLFASADRRHASPSEFSVCLALNRRLRFSSFRAGRLKWPELLARHVPDDRYSDFEWASVERHFGGVPIETAQHRGWVWFELEPIDPSGGANRYERDAFRLAAVLLSHWDNKAANQRLVCLDDANDDVTTSNCSLSFALINDLGATFGPNKVELDHWRATPV
jgi:hypothetical protein